jgi:signal transduction histidine kinase/DNA-binding response OmpR family regulator
MHLLEDRNRGPAIDRPQGSNLSNSAQIATDSRVNSPAARPMRILLVEDNPGDARLIATMLAEPPSFLFTLDCVDRLSDALRLLPTQNFDVVLLDLSLPDSQGLDTLARMRSGAPSAPIIVLTGLKDEATGIAAVKMGAQDFLVKGHIDGSLIARSMRYAIERKSAEEQLRHQQERVTALYEIHKAISSTLDLNSILRVLVEKSSVVLPGAAVTVELRSETGALEPVICRNLDERAWKAAFAGAGDSPSGMILKKRTPVVIGDLRTVAGVEDFFCANGLVSYLGVPLIAKDELFGVLGVYVRESHAFGNEEIEFLTAVSGQAAIAIRNSQLYQRTRDQAIQLERANGVKNEFISIISHELKTPVNVIMGYTNLLGQRMLGELNAKQQSALVTVSASARVLLEMITDILQVVCLEGGRLAPAFAELDLVSFLDDLRSSCKVPPGKKLALDWNYSSDLPMVQTDAGKLKQIILHLVNNAIKFTERGRVSVAMSYLEREDKFELRVKDSGIGINREMLPTIFEKFQQADSSSTRAYQGIGLGLYIVKNLTDLLAGTIDVRSEIGRGSLFTLTLPRRHGGLSPVPKGDGFFPD